MLGCSMLKLMQFLEVLARTFLFIREALLSNFWGLACIAGSLQSPVSSLPSLWGSSLDLPSLPWLGFGFCHLNLWLAPVFCCKSEPGWLWRWGARLAFYSAQEKAEAPAVRSPPAQRTPKAPGTTGKENYSKAGKAARKKPTNRVVVCKHGGQVHHPGASQSFQPVLAARGAAPISGLLGSPKAPLKAVAKMMGPPPKTQHPISSPSPLKEKEALFLPEDEPADIFQHVEKEPSRSSPVAQALLEQSRALSALLAHFHSASTDPMTDLSSATSLVGVKGTPAEKSCTKKSSGSGSFYLRVCQTASRRMSPASPIAQTMEQAKMISLILCSCCLGVCYASRGLEFWCQ